MKGGDHRGFGDGHDDAILHRHCRRYTQLMAVHAPFAEELKRLKDRDHGFLTLFGQDSEFDLTLLNVEHSVRDIALLEYFLVLVKFEDLFPGTNLFEKVLWVEHVCRRFAHRSLLGSDVINSRRLRTPLKINLQDTGKIGQYSRHMGQARFSPDAAVSHAAFGRAARSNACLLMTGGLNRSKQHFILEGKDGVRNGTKIS